MTILRIDNTVRDYEAWKVVFDKFDRVRREHDVRGYQISRHHDDPDHVTIDLEFDHAAGAIAFREVLLRIWDTPQSRQQLSAHEDPQVLDLVEDRAL